MVFVCILHNRIRKPIYVDMDKNKSNIKEHAKSAVKDEKISHHEAAKHSAKESGGVKQQKGEADKSGTCATNKANAKKSECCG